MAGVGRGAILVVLTALLLTVSTGAQPTVRADGQLPGAPVTSPAVDRFRSTRTYEQVAAPVRLRVPAAQVDTALQRLARNADGTIAVPASTTVAGWYAEGPRPGQRGPAVIVGHVDSVSGPGVFVNLSRLPVGAAIYVDDAEGNTVTFRVTALSHVPKTEFPTDVVYLPTLEPSLRLVTCGGTFDFTAHSYRDNVIVYADPR